MYSKERAYLSSSLKHNMTLKDLKNTDTGKLDPRSLYKYKTSDKVYKESKKRRLGKKYYVKIIIDTSGSTSAQPFFDLKRESELVEIESFIDELSQIRNAPCLRGKTTLNARRLNIQSIFRMAVKPLCTILENCIGIDYEISFDSHHTRIEYESNTIKRIGEHFNDGSLSTSFQEESVSNVSKEFMGWSAEGIETYLCEIPLFLEKCRKDNAKGIIIYMGDFTDSHHLLYDNDGAYSLWHLINRLEEPLEFNDREISRFPEVLKFFRAYSKTFKDEEGSSHPDIRLNWFRNSKDVPEGLEDFDMTTKYFDFMRKYYKDEIAYFAVGWGEAWNHYDNPSITWEDFEGVVPFLKAHDKIYLFTGKGRKDFNRNGIKYLKNFPKDVVRDIAKEITKIKTT